ncbi:methyl-CpG-binding domain-containing protein 4 [Cucumis melo var. makuwa]|uniref:Methyl-CpG-binding domain-containing protein 4 n=1 Tax=Cucumis melo var. makuwa TaxID=1194695 RepID=A0A5A7UVI7_CUCMM|nr:methyl-CpG-binding domain-containing protein 4 [Cucumis melo var. makuwa]TYK18280.1 methyl-CpG-binding domain-containing protein 4 [Cucumis melo var. makuwa]
MAAAARPPKTPIKSTRVPVGLFAAQCEECFKWRLISTQEEYEDIRSRMIEEPFTCQRRTDTSCEDPPDINYDTTRTWGIDKPNIPKTPEGFTRRLVLRKNFTKFDAYYVTPTGKTVRSPTEILAFVQANPQYKDIALSNFSFAVPKIMEETVPESILKEGLNSSSAKRIKKTKNESAHTE